MNIPMRQYWSLLATYLKPQWWRVLLLFVLLVTSVTLELINPQFLRSFVDIVSVRGPFPVILGTAFLYLGIALADQVISVLTTYVSEKLRWAATNALRVDLLAHCLRLDMPFHNVHTPGEMIERIDGDINALSNFFSQFVVQLLGSLFLLLGILLMLFHENWLAGLLFTAFAGLVLLALRRVGGLVGRHWEGERQASSDLYGFLEERLAGLADIRTNGAQSYTMRKFYQYARLLYRKGTRAYIFGDAMMYGVIRPLFLLGTLGILLLSAYLYQNGAISIGTVFLFVSYIQMLRSPLEQISTQLQDLQRAGASIGRIRKLYNEKPGIQNGPGAVLPGGPLGVTFQNVSFAYQPEKFVLEDITFHVPPGKVLGLLGHTGSGKTSLMRLLFRLYEADRGTIQLGESDIKAAPVADLRKRVSMVTQDVQLFQATLRDNVTFFDRAIPDERILETFATLGLSQWYQTLPEGLDTRLGMGERGLSAGQAQLIAFARVFLQDPGLVILDEASSRLDPATEQLIERAVRVLLRDRSGIIIAHRLATVQHVDDILILEAGRVREYGSRSDLGNDPTSYFSHLLKTGLEEVLS